MNISAPTKEQFDKYEKLKSYIANLSSVAVAFSDGVDSTFLLFVAKETLADKAIAITANLNSFPEKELDGAIKFCKDNKIKHLIANIDEFQFDGFCKNPPDRCYICKKAIFSKIIKMAENEQITNVIEGSNLDDEGDYRPGIKAIKELGIKSPLKECGFTKNDIRVLSKYYNVATWEKPSYACLASRFPYGEEITKEKLIMVEKSEKLLSELGFNQYRVRIHGRVARIELLPEDFEKIVSKEIRDIINTSLKSWGFEYISLDLAGYRTGSMNEVLKLN